MLGKKKKSSPVEGEKNVLHVTVSGSNGLAEMAVKSVEDINNDGIKEKSVRHIITQKGWSAGEYECTFKYTALGSDPVEEVRNISVAVSDSGGIEIQEITEEDEGATTILEEPTVEEVALIEEEKEELAEKVAVEEDYDAEPAISKTDIPSLNLERQYDKTEGKLAEVASNLSSMLTEENEKLGDIRSESSTCSFSKYMELKKNIVEQQGITLDELDELVVELYEGYESLEHLEMSAPSEAAHFIMQVDRRNYVMSNLKVLLEFFPNMDVEYVLNYVDPSIFGIKTGWGGAWSGE